MENPPTVMDETVVGRRSSNTPDAAESVQHVDILANARMPTAAKPNGCGCIMSECLCEPNCCRGSSKDNEIEQTYSFKMDENAKYLRRCSLDRFDFDPAFETDEPRCSHSDRAIAGNKSEQDSEVSHDCGSDAGEDGEFRSLQEFLQTNPGYKLMPERIDDQCPHMRYAEDTVTEEKVIIVFYGFHVSAEHLAPYRKMEECNCVPKLLSIIRPHQGESFLVFQCGEYTLSQWMTDISSKTADLKREVAFKILSAIAEFHEQRIVHGNLSLSTIMWFPDGSWKLLFPMFTRWDGVGYRLVSSRPQCRGACPYTAPEIRRVIRQRESGIRIDFSSDMWSFGIIACEILQDASCANLPGTSSESISEYRSSRRIYRKFKCIRDPNARKLVKKLTSPFPDDRLSCNQAVENAFFKAVRCAEPGHRWEWTVVLRNVMELRKQHKQHIEMTRQHHAESRASDVCADISIEYFRRSSNPKHEFYQRKGRRVFNIRDAWLPEKLVPLLKVREDYRLRVALTNRRESSMEALNIKNIEVSVGDGKRKQSLRLHQEDTDSLKHEVCAFLEPKKLESKRLDTVGPCFGDLDDKYVTLNILIEFTTDDDGPVQTITHKIRCRMVSPRCMMALPRFIRALCKGWRCLPTEIQGGALVLFIAAKFAVGL